MQFSYLERASLALHAGAPLEHRSHGNQGSQTRLQESAEKVELSLTACSLLPPFLNHTTDVVGALLWEGQQKLKQLNKTCMKEGRARRHIAKRIFPSFLKASLLKWKTNVQLMLVMTTDEGHL